MEFFTVMYLLRVGADYTQAGGGFHSPIFEDLSYLFIPIPEDVDKVIREKLITYRDVPWANQSVLHYIGKRMTPQQAVHNDPEFVTFTYGSPKYAKNGRKDKNYETLSNMKPGDVLVFYAAFTNKHQDLQDDRGGLYFFAYFTVDEAITYDHPESLDMAKRAKVANNHHSKHGYKHQVVVVGSPDSSRVFNKAVRLSLRNQDRRGGNYYPSREILSILGNASNKPMNRSSLRRIASEARAQDFREYLDKHCG